MSCSSMSARIGKRHVLLPVAMAALLIALLPGAVLGQRTAAKGACRYVDPPVRGHHNIARLANRAGKMKPVVDAAGVCDATADGAACRHQCDIGEHPPRLLQDIERRSRRCSRGIYMSQ